MDFLGKVDRQYNKFFRKAKAIVYSYKARKRARKFEGKLTKGQLQQINDFYAPYMKVSPVFHAYYRREGENSFPIICRMICIGIILINITMMQRKLLSWKISATLRRCFQT